MCLPPLLAFSGPMVQWPDADFKTPFNENLTTTAPNVTLAALAQRARLPIEMQIEGRFTRAYCIPGGDPGFVTVTTERGQDHQIQIDGQAASPGLPSLREAIARTYGAAIWLS